MVNGIEDFLKDVDGLFYKMLDGYPKNMAETKLHCLRVFVSMCNDYSRSNRMLKSAFSILRNEDNIKALHSEMARSIDFQEIEELVQLYNTHTESYLQNALILEFHSNLDRRANYSVKSWIYWAEKVANRLIQESTRQFTCGEMESAVDPFKIWEKVRSVIYSSVLNNYSMWTC
jgi:hypothetical protein